jgi:tRNA (guanosine-2'-O-)-methyltransferase
MRRITGENADVFRPKGQLKKELELAAQSPEDVIRVLSEQLSPERAARIESVVSHRTRRLTVAIEGVYDPHNTAAVIRTADAYGVQAVHVIERGIKFRSSRRVTQGAHKWVDLGVWNDARDFADAVSKQGKRILVAVADSAQPLAGLDPEEPLALVFGNEHEGVSPLMREVADGTFAIPMFGFVESFNISVAAAITMAALRSDGKGNLEPTEALELRARFYLRAVRSGCDIVKRVMNSEAE